MGGVVLGGQVLQALGTGGSQTARIGGHPAIEVLHLRRWQCCTRAVESRVWGEAVEFAKRVCLRKKSGKGFASGTVEIVWRECPTGQTLSFVRLPPKRFGEGGLPDPAALGWGLIR